MIFRSLIAQPFPTIIDFTASQSNSTPNPGPGGGVNQPPAIIPGPVMISRSYRNGPNVSIAYGNHGSATAKCAQAAVAIPISAWLPKMHGTPTAG